MARSSTVAELLWNNIGWSEDCLTVLYEKGKTNQDGENKVPRHVFANPDNPAICPILALGLRLCCDRSTFESIPFKVFSASTSHKSYSSWLRNAALSFSEDIQEIIDVPANRIGSHSLRKGSATYVVGLTEGPDSDSVKLRMEHSLGGTDDRYIKREIGSDKYVGRAVAGLNHNDVRFSVLPPHFKCPVNVEAAISLPFLERANESYRCCIGFFLFIGRANNHSAFGRDPFF